MPYQKFPVDTVVRLRKTNQFALIKEQVFLMNHADGFLHYMIEIEGRPGLYAGYDDDFELECLPIDMIYRP